MTLKLDTRLDELCVGPRASQDDVVQGGRRRAVTPSRMTNRPKLLRTQFRQYHPYSRLSPSMPTIYGVGLRKSTSYRSQRLEFTCFITELVLPIWLLWLVASDLEVYRSPFLCGASAQDVLCEKCAPFIE